jgi:hypothetical protein
MNKFRVLRNGKFVREIEAENLAEAQKKAPRLIDGRRGKDGHWMAYEWQKLEGSKGWIWIGSR